MTSGHEIETSDHLTAADRGPEESLLDRPSPGAANTGYRRHLPAGNGRRSRSTEAACDRFRFPDGAVVRVLDSPTNPARAPLVMEFSVPPGAMPTAAHVHPRQEETYAVQEGVVEVLIGREWFTIETGRSARVPAGTPHAFRNRSGATVRFLNEHRPALRFEEYFRTVHGLADASKVKGGFDVRGVLYACVLMEQYDDTIQPARGMQRLAIGVLAAVARLLRISGREQAQTRGPRPSPASARGNVTEHPPPYGEKDQQEGH
jgi:mannose-6-phosphate isomerase-like protein (cupin superfamily)